MSNLYLKEIKLTNRGKRIYYSYNISKEVKKFFKEPFFLEYDTDLNGVPDSILVIPFLANMLPISWLAGFDIEVNTLDKRFYQSIIEIKEVFSKEFPSINMLKSELIFNKLEDNSFDSDKEAMLFSGGVDAYATFFNRKKENMDLILIQGADIPLNDKKQWNVAKSYIDNEAVLMNNVKHFIKMNCRDFYTYHVDELIKSGSWWGKVQHGLCLTAAVAPLAYQVGYQKIYIAATHNHNFKIFWGSMPDIDNSIKWASTKVYHDGYNMTRIDKIESIVSNKNLLGKNINLRVCYSEVNSGLNCNKCEKCYRTMFGITLFGFDPNNFGFNTDYKFYSKIESLIENGFSTKGIRYSWECMLNTLVEKEIYQFNNHYYDKSKLEKKLQLALLLDIKSDNYSKNIKYKIIKHFPRLFKIYLKIRGLNK